MKMDENILNKVYAAAIEFGKNCRRPLSEIMEELYPELSDTDKKMIGEYIVQTRKNIEHYISERFVPGIYDTEATIIADRELKANGYKWIKKQYEWMNEENIKHAVYQAMYYAWHG